MKVLFVIFIGLFTSLAHAEVLYNIGEPTSYPTMVQEAIVRDLKNPNPQFKTTVLISKKEFTPEFISQLNFDKVVVKTKPQGPDLVEISLDYSKTMQNQYHGITKTHLHLIGERIRRYVGSSDCKFNQFLKDNHQEDFRMALFNGMRGGVKEFWYLNYTASNLVMRKDPAEALKAASLYCQSQMKQLTLFESVVNKLGLLPKRNQIELPTNYPVVSLTEILSKQYF